MMTFKKTVSAFCACLLLAACLSGCAVGEPESYQCFIVDGLADRYYRAPEVEYWQGLHFKADDTSDRSGYALGNHYTGTYVHSEFNSPNSFITDKYRCENGIEFQLRRDTGETVSVNFRPVIDSEEQSALPDVENPNEALAAIAREVAAEFVRDLSEYTETLSDAWTDRFGVMSYSFSFVKKIEGYSTSDCILVSLNSKGTLLSFRVEDVNAFDDVDLSFDKRAVEQSIREKTEAAFAGSILTVTDITMGKQRIVLTPDGLICVDTYVDIVGTYNILGTEDTTIIRIITAVGTKAK